MTDTLHFAFEYWDRGWPVIPVAGKRPAVVWRAYQQKRPELEDICKWFVRGSFNLAIVTGSVSGLVVIDCDSPEDAAWWRTHHTPTPLVVTTGRGGTHFYYQLRGKVGSPTGIFGRKIDVRGEGALAVAPPSVTQRAYVWQPWDHYSLDEIPVLDPTWLGPERRPTFAPQVTRTIRRGLAYIRHIEAVSGSGGHNQTFRAACKLRDSGLSPDEALDALRTWNVTNAEPPWTDRELAHKIQDAYQGVSS